MTVFYESDVEKFAIGLLENQERIKATPASLPERQKTERDGALPMFISAV